MESKLNETNQVTCNVVKDLLPLYVDEVLSTDSQKLVEGHLDTCGACKKYYAELKQDNVVQTSCAIKDKEVFRRVKRKVNMQKIIAVCAAVLAVVLLAVGLGYGIFFRESYISYEDSGLYVEDGLIKTSVNYFCSYGYDDPENEVEFIFLTTTAYENTFGWDGVKQMITLDTDRTTILIDEKGERTECRIKEIYYVPKQYAKKLRDQHYWESVKSDDVAAQRKASQKNAELTQELKEVSVLVWQED